MRDGLCLNCGNDRVAPVRNENIHEMGLCWTYRCYCGRVWHVPFDIESHIMEFIDFYEDKMIDCGAAFDGIHMREIAAQYIDNRKRGAPP